MSAMSSPTLGPMTGGSSGEQHVDLKPPDNSEAAAALRAAETVYQLAMQQISQEVEVSQELLIYPAGEGEVDAVAITDRDMQELLPQKSLGNNIVDFYIRFLERELSPEHGNRFHFFNSFFFTKLLQSTSSTGIDPCKVDYKQLRKWTAEVNLFAKDYVFIPILKSSHWSLVIICHLSNLTCLPGEMTRYPCVVHLDPIEGQHESFEGLIRSYVLQAWMERFQVSSNGDQLLALCQMKYVEAKVPRQGNLHDCGLYVLNYIEAFLAESTSSDFSFASNESGPHFIGPHFVPMVMGKRKHIQNLIHELRGLSLKRAKKRRAIAEVLQSTQNLRHVLFDEGSSEVCINYVQTVGPSCFNGEGYEMNHSSTSQNALDHQDKQSTLISMGDNEPLDGPPFEPMKYGDGSECLSPLKQQYAKREVQIGGPSYFNGSISVAKHASTHGNAMDVQHQQRSGLSRLDYEHLDVPEHVSHYQEVNEDNMVQPPMSEEAQSMDLCEVQRGENKRGRKMTDKETKVLLSCMVKGGGFCKGSSGRTHWNLISEKIEKKLGSLPSADQCRLRYDTLLKAYKTCKEYFMKTGKTVSALKEAKQLGLKLATTLSEEMYTTMDKIHENRTKSNLSQKRMKLSSEVCEDLHPSSSRDSLARSLPPMSRGRSFEDGAVVLNSARETIAAALCNIFPASVSCFLNEDSQSTLLNLVQECPWGWSSGVNKNSFNLEEVCRRLAIVQDCEPREILNYILKLWKLDFVYVAGMLFEEGNDLAQIDLWKDERWFLKSEIFEKISEEVLCKNPQFRTYCQSYPFEQSWTQNMRVLSLLCCELEHLDLRAFPNLRSLSLFSCQQLNLVTGWEVPTGLASLEISWCNAYLDFPEVRYLLCLREIKVIGRKFNESGNAWQLSQFSHCSKLRRVQIWCDESLSEIADLESLKELKFLEFLCLGYCSFSSIQGLSGLQALTTLELVGCKGLKSVAGLGCLKRLTHLSMCGSGIDNLQGVEELLLLTFLDLCSCGSLRKLPFIGHLKALVHLDLRKTLVKKIPVGKNLINLKTALGRYDHRWNPK